MTEATNQFDAAIETDIQITKRQNIPIVSNNALKAIYAMCATVIICVFIGVVL